MPSNNLSHKYNEEHEKNIIVAKPGQQRKWGRHH
jgi:hypothetical protein